MSLQGSLCRLLLSPASGPAVDPSTTTTSTATVSGSAVSPCLNSHGVRGAAPVQYQSLALQQHVSGGVSHGEGGGVVLKPFSGENSFFSGELSRQGRHKTFLPSVLPSSPTQQAPPDFLYSLPLHHSLPPPHPRLSSSPPRQLFDVPPQRYDASTHHEGRENPPFQEGFPGEGRYPHHHHFGGGGERRLVEQEQEAFRCLEFHSPVSSVVSIAPSSSSTSSSPLLPLAASLLNPKPSSLPSVEDLILSPSSASCASPSRPPASSFVRAHTPSITQLGPAPLDHTFVSREISACMGGDDEKSRRRRQSLIQLTAGPSCEDGLTSSRNPLPRKKKSPKGGSEQQQSQTLENHNKKCSPLHLNTLECSSPILGKTTPFSLSLPAAGGGVGGVYRNPKRASHQESSSCSSSTSHPQQRPPSYSQAFTPKSYTNSGSSPEALLSQASALAQCLPGNHSSPPSRHHEKIKKNQTPSDKKSLLFLQSSLHAPQQPYHSSSLSLLGSSAPQPTTTSFSSLLGVGGREEGSSGRGERGRLDLDLGIRGREQPQQRPYCAHLEEADHQHETFQSREQQQEERHSLLHGSLTNDDSPSQNVALSNEGGKRYPDEAACHLSSPRPPLESLKGSRDACILVTLPLSLPYGKIVNLITPSTGSSEAETAAPPFHTTRVEGGGGESLHSSSASSSSSRGGGGGGSKRNYYWFDPRTHPDARKLFSPVAGICDTYAAALHVELAIIHVPEMLLPEVANMFLAHANEQRTQQRLAFKTPLSFKCGNLQERSAPCRAGGRVFTLESIFDSVSA